jgi:hypothetical protein
MKMLHVAINERSWVVLLLLCVMYGMSYFHRASPAVLSMDIMHDSQ